MRLPVAALLVASLLLAACGGDDAYKRAAETAVTDAVVTLDDLPDGWVLSELEIEGYPELELTGDCAPLAQRGEGFEGEVATSSSEPLEGPDQEQMTTSVTVFSDASAAENAMREADALVFQCEDQLRRAFEAAIRDAAADRNVADVIRDLNITLERGEVSPFGEQTAAYHLRAAFSALLLELEVNGDIIAIRDGPVTGILTYFRLGNIDKAAQEQVLTLLSGNVSQARQSLPD